MKYLTACLTIVVFLNGSVFAQDFPRIQVDMSGMGQSPLAKLFESRVVSSSPAADAKAVKDLLQLIESKRSASVREDLEELGFVCRPLNVDTCSFVGSYFYNITLGSGEMKRTDMRFEVLIKYNKEPMEVKVLRTVIK